MTTFLAFVLHRLVGPPNRAGLYPCPFRDHSSDPHQVAVNEPASDPRTGRQYAIKARCFRGCGYAYGSRQEGCFDEIDLIKFVHRVNLAKALVIKDDLLRDFEAGGGDPAATYSPHGDTTRRLGDYGPTDWNYLLRVIIATVERYDRLMDFLYGTEERHFAECEDPDCDWRVCRTDRGWTPEEIAADCEAHRAAKDAEDKARRDRHEELVNRMRSRTTRNGRAKR